MTDIITINLTLRKLKLPKTCALLLKMAALKSNKLPVELAISDELTADIASHTLYQVIKHSDYTIRRPMLFAGKNKEIFLKCYIHSDKPIEKFNDPYHEFGSLNLTQTIYSSLMGAGCYTINDLSQLSDSQLLGLRGVGTKSLITLRGYKTSDDAINALLAKRDKLQQEVNEIDKQLKLMMTGDKTEMEGIS